MELYNYSIIFLFTLLPNCFCEKPWAGRWFPHNPDDSSADENVTKKPDTSSVTTDSWKGKWFPHAPGGSSVEDKSGEVRYASFETDRIMGVKNKHCDDGEVNLAVDFDPMDREHSLRFMCLEPTIKPDFEVEPVLTIRDVPKLYTPVHKCMNESIKYEETVPTLGYHRPLWAQYGEYVYVPPQRWLHNIEHGAVVALYHPCANKQMVEKFKTLVKRCLRRHVITPYRIDEKRPFALAAWGVSLEFSVVDKNMVIDFIKKYAKTGPEKTSRDGQYNQLLEEAALLVTDIDDSQVCPGM